MTTLIQQICFKFKIELILIALKFPTIKKEEEIGKLSNF